jgi:Spy/CpxP family protein refolding chaperone
MIKKSLIALALVALVSANSYAQQNAQNPRGPGQGHDPVARMTEELQLDESQAAQLAEIMRDARAQHEALQTTERTEHCVIRAETDVLISEVLTDAQYARFEAMRNEHETRRNQGGGRGKPGRGDKQRAPLDCAGQLSTSNTEGQS